MLWLGSLVRLRFNLWPRNLYMLQVCKERKEGKKGRKRGRRRGKKDEFPLWLSELKT